MADAVDILKLIIGGPQGPTPPLMGGRAGDEPAAPTLSAAPAAGGNPFQEQIAKYIQAQMAQQEAARPKNAFQSTLQSLMLGPGRQSGQLGLLLSLLMGATGTPNPLTVGGFGRQGGRLGLGDILRLSQLPQQQEALTNRIALQNQALTAGKQAQEIMAAEAGQPGAEPGAPGPRRKVDIHVGTGPYSVTLRQPDDPRAQARERALGTASVKPPEIVNNQGVPYAIKDYASGKTYAFDDPKMPPELKPIIDGANKAHAQKLAQLTGVTRTMFDKAPTVKHFVDVLMPQVEANASKMGAMRGRIKQFMVSKVGTPDPEFNKMLTNLDLLSTALSNMHVGARGGIQMVEMFKNKLVPYNAENLKAALNEISNYADEKYQEGMAAGMTPMTTPTPGGTAQPTPAPTPRVGEVLQLPGLPAIRRVE